MDGARQAQLNSSTPICFSVFEYFCSSLSNLIDDVRLNVSSSIKRTGRNGGELSFSFTHTPTIATMSQDTTQVSFLSLCSAPIFS